jgi:hypothetical protein
VLQLLQTRFKMTMAPLRLLAMQAHSLRRPGLGPRLALLMLKRFFYCHCNAKVLAILHSCRARFNYENHQAALRLC